MLTDDGPMDRLMKDTCIYYKLSYAPLAQVSSGESINK